MDEKVVRLGVTGLSRAGKTVFITSLVASLKHRENMLGLVAASKGHIKSAWPQPLPAATTPFFTFEDHLGAMMPPNPEWPPQTTAVSGLRVTLELEIPGPFIAPKPFQKKIHLDIIDFPGEWLIDLTMMKKDFQTWSIESLEKIAFETLNGRTEAAEYLKLLQTTDTKGALDFQVADRLTSGFTTYLRALQKDGYSNCTPGRFLWPGDLKGAPALSFAPLYPRHGTEKGSLYKKFEERFEYYKEEVVKGDFFEKYLSKIDRQVVLMDVMRSIHDGPAPFQDQRKAMKNILSVFKPGKKNILAGLLGGNKVEKVLFAATKADYLHHSNHDRLKSYIEGIIQESLAKAKLAEAGTRAMAIAAVRVTTEGTTKGKGGKQLPCVSGRFECDQKITDQGFTPGHLPDINQLLTVAKKGAMAWPPGMNVSFKKFKFLPHHRLFDQESAPPHLYLDQALEFLIGDLLK